MKPEEMKLGDWQRFLFGEVPPSFFIELLIRTVVMFAILVISMRLLGKRMAAQVTAQKCWHQVGPGHSVAPLLVPGR